MCQILGAEKILTTVYLQTSKNANARPFYFVFNPENGFNRLSMQLLVINTMVTLYFPTFPDLNPTLLKTEESVNNLIIGIWSFLYDEAF